MTKTFIRKTWSLCPECKQKLEAEIYEENGIVWMSKTCPEHGEFVEKYYENYEMYKRFERYATQETSGPENPTVKDNKDGTNCPFSCGLCMNHKSHTALLNMVLTNRCDLRCWYCFFYAKEGDKIYEPDLDTIRKMLRTARDMKPVAPNAVQFTGGEPTLRNDLIDIIKIAREEGFEHIQLNTNGINLARKPELALELKEAGVNTIYLSFDGVTQKTNPKNHKEIPKILKNLRKAGGPGVVLVPTIIRGVNDHELWDIIKFALDNLDIVRGVNFQPVSLVGRMPRELREQQRITIPGAIIKIEEQSDGIIKRDDFYPVPCVTPISNFVERMTGRKTYKFTNHFACGAATYVFKDEDRVIPITRSVDVDGFFKYLTKLSEELERGKDRHLVGAKLLVNLRKFINKENAPKGMNIYKILVDVFLRHNYEALGKFHHKTLFIGMMHFMDLYNYDVQRVERCSIHYALPNGTIVPFCTFNVLPEIYRDQVQDKYSITQEEWERKTGKKLSDDFYREIKEEA